MVAKIENKVMTTKLTRTFSHLVSKALKMTSSRALLYITATSRALISGLIVQTKRISVLSGKLIRIRKAGNPFASNGE